MKLNLLILFTFVVGWVLGDVAHASYNEKLMWSTILSLIIAYLNDAHKIAWAWLMKKMQKGQIYR